MKATRIAKNRHATRRDAALAQIGQSGPFLEGHLSSFKRHGCAQPGWHLTFKVKGVTRTVYVPMDLVAQVKLWTRNHQRLKKLIRQVTRHSLAIIKSHVANRRAASRIRPSKRPKAPKA
jgi:hypothetical protein